MPFIQLESSEYDRILPLITESERVYLPLTFSILERIQQGAVYVDTRHKPTCAVTMLENERTVNVRLLGTAENCDFNSGLVDYLKRASGIEGDSTMKILSISTAALAWEPVIFQAVGYRVMRVARTQFGFSSSTFCTRATDFEKPNLAGLTMRPIDNDLISRSEKLTQYIESLWNGIENYLQHSVGWVVMEGDAIRGSCDGVFVGGNLAELNIKVAKELRGRGVGTALAVNFIRDCLAKGLTPNWTCDTDNAASYQMAQKLGFTPLCGYYEYTTHNWTKSHEPARV